MTKKRGAKSQSGIYKTLNECIQNAPANGGKPWMVNFRGDKWYVWVTNGRDAIRLVAEQYGMVASSVKASELARKLQKKKSSDGNSKPTVNPTVSKVPAKTTEPTKRPVRPVRATN